VFVAHMAWDCFLYIEDPMSYLVAFTCIVLMVLVRRINQRILCLGLLSLVHRHLVTLFNREFKRLVNLPLKKKKSNG